MSMDDFAHDLMWESAGGDIAAENKALARTAALVDAEAVWPLLQGASTLRDLEHRLVLADERLTAIAERRGYGVEDLREDLRGRFGILCEARVLLESEAQERDLDTARLSASISAMAARAAQDNPTLPMAQCLDLATQAARQHLAGPLDYSSWNNVPDGPLTSRVKHWSPDDPTGSSDGSGGSDPDVPMGESPSEVDSPSDSGVPSDSVSAQADPLTPSGESPASVGTLGTDALELAASRKAYR